MADVSVQWTKFLAEEESSRGFPYLWKRFLATESVIKNSDRAKWAKVCRSLYWRERLDLTDPIKELSSLEADHVEPWPLNLFCAVVQKNKALGRSNRFKTCWANFRELMPTRALWELRVRDDCVKAYRRMEPATPAPTTERGEYMRGGRRCTRNASFVAQKHTRRLNSQIRHEEMTKIRTCVASINRSIATDPCIDKESLAQTLLRVRHSVSDASWFSKTSQKRIVAIQRFLSKRH